MVEMSLQCHVQKFWNDTRDETVELVVGAPSRAFGGFKSQTNADENAMECLFSWKMHKSLLRIPKVQVIPLQCFSWHLQVWGSQSEQINYNLKRRFWRCKFLDAWTVGNSGACRVCGIKKRSRGMSGAQFWVTIINSWCLMEEACSWHLFTENFRTPYLGGYINDYCQRRYGFGVEKLLVCRLREPSMCNPDVSAHPSTRRDLKSSLASNWLFLFPTFVLQNEGHVWQVWFALWTI